MRTLNTIKRKKDVFQFSSLEEFKKGDWLKEIPPYKDNTFIEINYKSNKNILIINIMEAKSLNNYMEEREDGKREADE